MIETINGEPIGDDPIVEIKIPLSLRNELADIATEEKLMSYEEVIRWLIPRAAASVIATLPEAYRNKEKNDD